MGNGVSIAVKEQYQRNREIENEMRKSYEEAQKALKLLLLGAAEAGKSTILKQMRVLHADGFSKEDLKAQKVIIYANVVESILAIVHAMPKFGLQFEDYEREADFNVICAAVEQDQMKVSNKDVLQAMKRLWEDKSVQRCFARKNEYQLNDSTQYFFDSLDRLSDPGYVPTQDDVLRARMRTTGIVEVTFKLQNMQFRVFDVGGQRSERRKWIHCFDDTSAIMFLASLSEYDQVLFEDNVTNRMMEALMLFETICNSRFFDKASMMLFLNKKDLFAEKLKTSPLTIAFPQYNGNLSYEDASCFIRDTYLKRNHNPRKQVFVHFTCATDTNQIEFVLDSAVKTIIINNVKGFGLS